MIITYVNAKKYLDMTIKQYTIILNINTLIY
jgi:hypothetical protein